MQLVGARAGLNPHLPDNKLMLFILQDGATFLPSFTHSLTHKFIHSSIYNTNQDLEEHPRGQVQTHTYLSRSTIRHLL